ncbi:MAG: DUF547 domain-containing protein [Nitrospinota bacterium]|nr:DUF547 domain-containing protein [Nitrospinota bacterium]
MSQSTPCRSAASVPHIPVFISQAPRVRHIPLVFAMIALSWLCLYPIPAAHGRGGFDHDHAIFNKLLGEFVEDGRVDYPGLANNRKRLDQYLAILATVPENQFTAWDEPDRIAFLINLYNAATLKLILDHYPVESIKDIGGWFSTPWEAPVAQLWGITVTLDMIEHQILRKRYDEPRIHAALVCAAMGCPQLRYEAFVGRRLEEQLNNQMRLFLSVATKNRVDRAAGVIHLSPIFKWYSADFEKGKRSLLGFLRPFWPDMDRGDFDNQRDWRIKYTFYNWSLNKMGRKKIE